jgi:hypothetical protein
MTRGVVPLSYLAFLDVRKSKRLGVTLRGSERLDHGECHKRFRSVEMVRSGRIEVLNSLNCLRVESGFTCSYLTGFVHAGAEHRLDGAQAAGSQLFV